MITPKVMKLISFIMFVIAIIFLAVAFTHPEFGTVFYIGNLAIGSDVWRAFYILYSIVMIGLFSASLYLAKKSR